MSSALKQNVSKRSDLKSVALKGRPCILLF
jgi:hypothetical protein